MIKSVYIHIPFCDRICSYCDFCKILYNKKFINKYLDSLEKEIDNTYKDEIIDTIYIGGGTPSSLDIAELDKLFKIISKFKVSKDLEFTIEGNFESTTFDKLDLYKKCGVNRLSFGIETTNNELLSLLNRSLDKKHVISIINYAKNIGICNINVDLMYALPGEDIDILKKDLDFIMSLDIKHISTYSLILEDHTLLSINKYKNISEDLDLEMYNYICKCLKNNAFNHYEISNFCKEGYYSRHNSIYWNNLEYYGFGLGASSYIENKRINNTRSINKYFNNNYILNYEELSDLDVMNYEIMLNLRLSSGIDKIKFFNKYQRSIDTCYNYSELIEEGYLIDNGDNIYIPDDKWYVSNSIIIKFLEGYYG